MNDSKDPVPNTAIIEASSAPIEDDAPEVEVITKRDAEIREKLHGIMLLWKMVGKP